MLSKPTGSNHRYWMWAQVDVLRALKEDVRNDFTAEVRRAGSAGFSDESLVTLWLELWNLIKLWPELWDGVKHYIGSCIAAVTKHLNHWREIHKMHHFSVRWLCCVSCGIVTAPAVCPIRALWGRRCHCKGLGKCWPHLHRGRRYFLVLQCIWFRQPNCA